MSSTQRKGGQAVDEFVHQNFSLSPSLSWCVNLILYVLNYINNCYGSPSLLSWPESMFFRLATLASTCHFPTPVHSPRRRVASGFRPLALNTNCLPLKSPQFLALIPILHHLTIGQGVFQTCH